MSQGKRKGAMPAKMPMMTSMLNAKKRRVPATDQRISAMPLRLKRNMSGTPKIRFIVFKIAALRCYFLNINPLNVCFAKQALLLVNIRLMNKKACDWSRSW